MRKRVLLIIFAGILLLARQAAALEPEDMLRNMPAPEVNYPVNEIRAITPPALMPALAAEAVPLPPEKPSYEAKKLVTDIQEKVSSPVIDSTRKLLGNLARPPAGKKVHSLKDLASSSEGLITSSSTALASSKKAIRPQALLTATSTQLIAAVNKLASNPALIELRRSFAADSALAADIFALYLEPAQEQENPETIKGNSYDSVLVTAIGLYKKSQWQELKNIFAENPEAGETPDGLKYQIEAELNAEKPNYMAARRFADKLLEADKSDPLGNYTLALFFYNSKKPNLVKAQQALNIALQANKPPDGAAKLYWIMTLKKFAIPLLALIAVIIAGITQIIKKRKAASSINIDLGDLTEPVTAEPSIAKPNSESQPSPAIPGGFKAKLQQFKENLANAGGFKAKLQQLKEKLLPLLSKLRRQKPGEQSEIILESSDTESKAAETKKTNDKQPETTPVAKATNIVKEDSDESDNEAENPSLEDEEEIVEIEEIEEIEEEVEITEESVEEIVEEIEKIAEDGVEYEEVEVEVEAEDGVEYEEVEVEVEAEDGVEYEEVEVEEIEEVEGPAKKP